VGIAIGATAVGALTLGSGFLILRSLKPPRPAEQTDPMEQADQTEQIQQIQQIQQTDQTVPSQSSDDVAYICVNSSELEEITQLLMTNRMRFFVGASLKKN
jgi:hypothetical protein